MLVPEWLEKQFIRLTDVIFARLPQPAPDAADLARCKLVSHRGEYDNVTVFENTLAAFQPLATNGVWGVECDLRWTRDLQPVIIHDPDFYRLFKDPTPINTVTLVELKRRHPLVPTLAEVVDAFGGRLHLKLEVKKEVYPDPDRQNRTLEAVLSGLKPKRDYHLLTLTPEMFDLINFTSADAFCPIAQISLPAFSRLALEKGYRGVNGHYLFMTKAMIRRHHRRGQQVGTGFIASKNSLYREINRSVDWIYSNHALMLRRYL